MNDNKDDNKDKLLDSDYDGIKEYDNDLPRWWVNIFWVTTIYAIFYVGYVHFGFAPSDDEKLAVQMKEIEALRAASKAAVIEGVGEVSESTLLALVSNTEQINTGKAVYDSKCAVCHGPKGQGLIGPNMTDDNWIHGGKLMEIRQIILKGVLEKGMLAWEGVIPDNEINAVTAYIRTLRGTNPENPKAAEGELYVPES